MKVIVAEKCGFCHGVKNAISMAEEILEQSAVRKDSTGGHRRKASPSGLTVENDVYSLGPIIHNRDMVEQLAKKGLKTVDNVEDILNEQRTTSNEQRTTNSSTVLSSLSKDNENTVLIRSHGAAPEQIAKIKEKGLNIVDATCVLVKRMQRIARELGETGYKVVVIGNENHPEVQAVVGCAEGVVVIADESDLHKLPKNGKLGIVCQTTQSPEHFGKMLGAIAVGGFSELKVINTLCEEAVKRQESAVQLCRRVDIMFVLGGLESANTRKLAELCKKVNRQTFHLQNWNELDKSILFGKNMAGVTAGASTPEWIIAEFVENLKGQKTEGRRESEQ